MTTPPQPPAGAVADHWRRPMLRASRERLAAFRRGGARDFKQPGLAPAPDDLRGDEYERRPEALPFAGEGTNLGVDVEQHQSPKLAQPVPWTAAEPCPGASLQLVHHGPEGRQAASVDALVKAPQEVAGRRLGIPANPATHSEECGHPAERSDAESRRRLGGGRITQWRP